MNKKDYNFNIATGYFFAIGFLILAALKHEEIYYYASSIALVLNYILAIWESGK